ncbi:MAG: 50S ribosomal protein L2 [Candidatus Magasanikbacteria bacterium RIFCSPHIGHO2_01_FULL_50_8]|uniref:Large ribosomal subunit protein uL2 n=1 Tax=Candidatus Magasanikbacteria bacterium RIFCSPHIGHO2_01_FULL_50_8 TaxID=1798674 RepID=A0A1F6LRD0_9BACT|nr:MAG: 50S ribosomal protein L2 [Candidatus Magasanikbacteria bacterium RIFCSPHIGHO2_01_FULL_50_8]
MPIRRYNPTTNARRQSSVDTFSDVTKFEPEKSLTIFRKSTGGRNNTGKITVRHRGGGARRYIRVIDFVANKFDVPATVAAIEYDPNRGARLALLNYPDGEKCYMIAPLGLGVGDIVMSSAQQIEAKNGNRMPLKFIPTGIMVHNIELKPGQGGKMVRSAGLSAQLMAVEGDSATLRMPSGEVRRVSADAAATVGQVGNIERNLIRWGKAGRSRLRGIRPTVRGKAMNPVDHPHGGGEGRNPIGMKFAKTPWGKHAHGVKTRQPNKYSNTFIVARRSHKKK